jgi:hypothetical protein
LFCLKNVKDEKAKYWGVVLGTMPDLCRFYTKNDVSIKRGVVKGQFGDS